MTKPCPACGRVLVIRTNAATGSQFWGCSGYATGECKHTEPIAESVLMRLLGAPELPLFEEIDHD